MTILGQQGTATFYHFDKAQPSAGHAGLQVFDATGSLTFDSNNAYMRIADILTVPAGSPNNPGGTASYTTSYTAGTLAFCVNWYRAAHYLVPRTANVSYVDAFSINGSTVSERWLAYKSTDNPQANGGFYFPSGSPQIMIIDVTNM